MGTTANFSAVPMLNSYIYHKDIISMNTSHIDLNYNIQRLLEAYGQWVHDHIAYVLRDNLDENGASIWMRRSGRAGR
jgi:hypothetical protein